MPENKNPPENEEEKISRVGEEIQCQHPDCKNAALSLSRYCWEHIDDKEVYRKKIEDWSNAGKSMEKFILLGADISGAQLIASNLSRALLWKTNFSKAILSQTNFSYALLMESNMSKAMLLGANLSRANLKKSDLSGVCFINANLSKAILSGASLCEADLAIAILSESNLIEANLCKTNLEGADLSKALLSESDLSKANLTGANLSGALLSKADLSEADLTGSNLSGALLNKANLTNALLNWANLTAAIALSKNNFSEKLTEEEKKDAEHYKESYLTVKNYFIQSGRYDDASWAAFRERTLERIAWYNEITEKGFKKLGFWGCLRTIRKWFGSKVISLLNGYGERPLRVVISSLAIVIFFSIIHYIFIWIQSYPKETLRWWDYLYFSIVTFTTLGYGDIRPLAAPWARLVASGEAFIGAFMIALFVWTLARRYVAR